MQAGAEGARETNPSTSTVPPWGLQMEREVQKVEEKVKEIAAQHHLFTKEQVMLAHLAATERMQKSLEKVLAQSKYVSTNVTARVWARALHTRHRTGQLANPSQTQGADVFQRCARTLNASIEKHPHSKEREATKDLGSCSPHWTHIVMLTLTLLVPPLPSV